MLSLSREPTHDELTQFEEFFIEDGPEERRLAIEDMFWALLTSREFLFQH